MHILVIFTYNTSLIHWRDSGLLDRELKIYRKLRDNFDIEFTFLTFGDIQDEQLVNDFKIIPFYKFNKKYKYNFLNIINSLFFSFKLKKLEVFPNLIKTNQLMGSWIGIVGKFLFKCPLLIRTGYDIFRFSIYDKKSFLKRFLYYVLTQISLIFCDIYVVTSKSDKIFLNKHFLNFNKIKILSNWVDTENISENINIINPSSNSILSVGRLESQKNFSELIKHFSMTDFKIDVVGSGSEKNNLSILAKELNVNLNFIGQLNNKELNELYKKYKFYITTSNYEGNSKSILEAKAAGCLVIAKENDNIADVITNNIDGIIFCNDNLKHIVDELNNDIEKSKFISHNAQNNVTKYNSLETIYKEEFNLYQKALKSN